MSNIFQPLAPMASHSTFLLDKYQQQLESKKARPERERVRYTFFDGGSKVSLLQRCGQTYTPLPPWEAYPALQWPPDPPLQLGPMKWPGEDQPRGRRDGALGFPIATPHLATFKKRSVTGAGLHRGGVQTGAH